MGTRSDFYIGIGQSAEWIGSVAYDGDPEDIAKFGVLAASSEKEFRKVVAKMADRDDFTSPEQGWPWPWADPRTHMLSMKAERFSAARFTHTPSGSTRRVTCAINRLLIRCRTMWRLSTVSSSRICVIAGMSPLTVGQVS
ncbi:hypothetical protein HFN89_05705 [Rhizobium laguerreae]|nr:hypothetical protein [Rhizobium laguerreae]